MLSLKWSSENKLHSAYEHSPNNVFTMTIRLPVNMFQKLSPILKKLNKVQNKILVHSKSRNKYQSVSSFTLIHSMKINIFHKYILWMWNIFYKDPPVTILDKIVDKLTCPVERWTNFPVDINIWADNILQTNDN